MKLLKETKSLALHGKWYQDACGTAFALELVGERWSILIMRELMLGGRRFSDLRASLPGISAKVLTERLTSLENAGVLLWRKLPPPAAAQIYELSEWGYLAEPAILELSRWAARSPAHNPTLPLSPVSFMLSLRTMKHTAARSSLRVSVGFTLAGESFLAELAEGELAVRRAKRAEGELTFEAEQALPLLRVFYGKQPLEEAEKQGAVIVTGDRVLACRFIDQFALPPKVASPGRE